MSTFTIIDQETVAQIILTDTGESITVVEEPTTVLVQETGVGLQGPQGAPGPSGPSGPVGVPNFYESSTQPLAPERGDQWIITTPLGG